MIDSLRDFQNLKQLGGPESKKLSQNLKQLGDPESKNKPSQSPKQLGDPEREMLRPCRRNQQRSSTYIKRIRQQNGRCLRLGIIKITRKKPIISF